MRVCCLASGSNGNSTLVESDKARVLIDLGISLKELTKRLTNIGIKNDEIDAVFVSHEHIDHIRGVGIFARKYNTPIFINKPTFEESRHIIGSLDTINLINSSHIKIKDLRIEHIKKFHDAADPVSFVVSKGRNKIGVITDLGIACNSVKEAVKELNCIVLESNHDLAMLRNGSYPAHLKQRIESKYGHLSNEDAALLLLEKASSKLKTVFLAHLSENNNTPRLAYDTFTSIISNRTDLNNLNVQVTFRYKGTELHSV